MWHGGDITDIFLLYGGSSPERAVAVSGALRIIRAFAESGHRITAHDYRSGIPEACMLDAMRRADAVLLALHGGEGEGGVLQATLEAAGIYHYAGTGAEGAALALDKTRAKACVEKAGVPVAAGSLWLPHTPPPHTKLPAIIKPVTGGSSVGLLKLESKATLAALSPTEPMLIEEYLAGREFTVGVLGDQALPAVEIIPHGGMYDYAHKYTVGACDELCPAPINAEEAKRLSQLALTAFHALGLRDFARIDFKENAAGVPCFLEANTLPGLTETSLLPLAAGAAGLSFTALCTYMAECAARRKIGVI